MSNEQSSNTSNNQPKSNRPQPPRRKQKPEEEGFQFNFFWIYAIIGAVLLLGLASNFALFQFLRVRKSNSICGIQANGNG